MSQRAARLCLSLYSLLWRLALPGLLARTWWRGRLEPGYRKHIGERFGYGRFGAAQAGLVIWVHAVSVGEARAAEPLVRAIQQAFPAGTLLLTCTTPAGRDTLYQLYGETVAVEYLPYDTPGAVRRFLERARPALAVLMETEIWPNLLEACHRRGIRVMLANARMSKKSARGYARTGVLARTAISAIDALCVQGKADARRLEFLGGHDITIAGNLKFDVAPDAEQIAQGRALRASLPARSILLLASTREGEEMLLLDALPRDSRMLLVMVPRHRQRFEEVAQLIAARGLRLVRRSKGDLPDGACDVFLGDTLGEMAFYYSFAQVAVIGGSFRPLGGQNLIEACAAGTPVVLGPHMFNFSDATREALRAEAAIQAADAAEALRAACSILRDPGRRARMSDNALAFALSHRGATAHHLSVCQRLLLRSP